MTKLEVIKSWPREQLESAFTQREEQLEKYIVANHDVSRLASTLSVERDALRAQVAKLEAACAAMRPLVELLECKCDTASYGGYTCPRCETLSSTDAGQSILDRLHKAEAALTARDEALRTAKEALGAEIHTHGHHHWDHTMQHGIGCEICIAQRKASELSYRALSKIDEVMK